MLKPGDKPYISITKPDSTSPPVLSIHHETTGEMILTVEMPQAMLKKLNREIAVLIQ